MGMGRTLRIKQCAETASDWVLRSSAPGIDTVVGRGRTLRLVAVASTRSLRRRRRPISAGSHKNLRLDANRAVESVLPSSASFKFYLRPHACSLEVGRKQALRICTCVTAACIWSTSRQQPCMWYGLVYPNIPTLAPFTRVSSYEWLLSHLIS